MYAIYGNSYHQYTPNVSIYTSTMDPMGNNSPTWNKATDLPFGRPGRLPPPQARTWNKAIWGWFTQILSLYNLYIYIISKHEWKGKNPRLPVFFVNCGQSVKVQCGRDLALHREFWVAFRVRACETQKGLTSKNQYLHIIIGYNKS